MKYNFLIQTLWFLWICYLIIANTTIIKNNQKQIISDQKTIILLLSPKYSHDIDDFDKMRVIKPKVGK